MKHFLSLFLIAFALVSSVAFAAPKYAKESKTPALLRDAQNAVNQKNIEKAVAAYQLVFAQPDLQMEDRIEAQFKLAQVYMNQKKPMRAEAIAEVEKVLAMKDAPADSKMRVYAYKANLRFRDNFPGSGYVNDDDGILDALALYQEAQKLPGLSNNAKIELSKQIANCYLELMKVDQANAELAKAVKLPGLTDEELKNAMLNQASVFKRQLRPDLAQEVYLKLLQNPTLVSNQRIDVLVSAANFIESKEGEAKALAFVKAQKDSERAVERFISNHSPTARINGYLVTVTDKKRDLAARKRAFKSCIDLAMAHMHDWKTANMLLDKHLPELLAENSDDVVDVLSWFTKPHPNHYKTLRGVPELHAKALAIAAKYQPNDVNVLQMQFFVARNTKDLKQMIALYGKMANVKDLPQAKQKEYAAINAILTGKNAKDVAKQVVALAKSPVDGKPVEPKAIVDFLQNNAQFALSVEKTEIARAIWAERNKFVVIEAKRSLPVTFIKNGPRDITQFLASPYIKDKKNVGVLDRKFGDNLQFILETDVSTGNRQITADTGTGAPTTFVATCDEQCVRLFFMMPCDKERINKIRNGYSCYGGHEMYLATGFDQPYHCFLVDMPPTEDPGSDGFVTMYDNKIHRRFITPNKNLKFTFRVDDTMIYMLCEFDWVGVMNGIPQNGDFWEFDSIHWERGGYSWGGCKSVHERSSFGLLVFENMTPENRTAIKRRLLGFAKRAYNAEVGQAKGMLGGWVDREIGDPEFAKSVIAPFANQYGDYAKAISAEMTDEQVNEIFDKAYPVLMNTKYVVEQMRSEYIKKKLTSED